MGTAYSQTLAATGGSGGYGWATNPAGTASLATVNLALSPAGLVSGTPTQNGSATFTATVTDSATHTASVTFTVTVSNVLTVTTSNSSLLPAYTGQAYSQQLAAAGGTGTGYAWTTTGSSNLATFNMTLSGTGLLSGTPSTAGTASFTAQVTDSASHTATQSFSIPVYAPLALPAAGALTPATISQSYSATVSATGGSGSYSWSVSGLPSGLGYNSTGNPLTISGTAPSTVQTITLNVTVTDTITTKSTGPIQYTIAVNPPTPLALPSPNPTSLPSAIVNQAYSGAINASGGSGSGYVFTVNGTPIPITGAPVTISDSITVSNTGGNTLSVGGTPTATGTVTLTNVTVKDSANDTAGPYTYTIAVNNVSQVSGRITLNNTCGSGSVPAITVSINTSPVQTTTTDSNGNYSFSNVPNGTYTITPSITGPSSLFYPATQSITVNNNALSGENFTGALGYTVSGTVTYTSGGTAQTGQTYLYLSGGCNGGNGGPGTSISEAVLTGGGNYTIRGVPPGSYTLHGWMDTLGQEVQNAIDPTGSASLTVTDANVTGEAVALANPTFTTPTGNPTISQIIPNTQGVMIEFSPSKNSNGVEDANEYLVQWSTSPTLGGGTGGGQFACAESGGTCPSHLFTASGDNGVWILTNAVLAGTGYSFASGQTYYFQARSFDTLDTANPHPSGWCNYTSTGCSGITGFTGVLIGTPACTGTCATVSSSVTIPAAIAIKAGAPLYLGLIQLSSAGGNPIGFYVTEITNPVNGANGFTVTVPIGSNYAVIGILDQNNTGGLGAGTISNTQNKLLANLTITASTTSVPGITLSTANSVATVTTQWSSYTCQGCGATTTSYQLEFDVEESDKLPVAVTLNSGPNLIGNSGTVALDMSLCNDCGHSQFQYSVTLLGETPNVGDTYGFTVTYSDGSQDTGSTVNGAVTGWNGTSTVVGAADSATGLSPNPASGGSALPDFAWTYPASAGSYVYSFYLCCFNNSDIWDIPSNNSKSSGFTSAQIPVPAGIQFPTDPTNSSNAPTVNPLTSGDTYNWAISVQDSNGNQAQANVYFVVP